MRFLLLLGKALTTTVVPVHNEEFEEPFETDDGELSHYLRDWHHEWMTEEDPTLWPLELEMEIDENIFSVDSLPKTTTTPSPIRIFEEVAYSHRELAILRPKLAHSARDQQEWDRMYGPRFAPLLYNNYEEYPEREGSVGVVLLDRRISSTRTSAVFTAMGNPNWVLKYQTDCDKGTPIHPILRDYYFLQKLGDTSLVPKVYYISPPTPMIETVTPKTSFAMTRAERTECVSKKNRAVRFMIMEHIHEDMYALMKRKGAPNLKAALQIMGNLVRGLWEMHSRGIVHGDIHPGNIGFVLNKDSKEEGRLVFFDFGSAFHIEEKVGKPDKDGESMSYIHCLYSHWNLEGFRFGFRDDVFKAMMVGAFLMNGPGWMDYCVALEKKPIEMLEFKRDSFLFEYPKGPKLAAKIPGFRSNSKKFKALKQLLTNVLALAREPHDVNDHPNYAEICTHIDAAIALLP
jgi:hypothetical protein